MQGRSSRFGMFGVVKLPEAVSIAAALILLALRGASSSRVGGAARPISKREMAAGKLNASLIAAESGIFEGIATSLSIDRLRNIKGNFATEAAPAAVVAGDGCALSYSLCESELVRYNEQRKLLLPRGVAAVLSVHCHGRKHMKLSEFAQLHSAVTDLQSIEAADYFFSVIDSDQDDCWSLADLQHFLVEKRSVLREEGVVLSGLHEIWACLRDMIRPSNLSAGISRREFLRLSPKDRRTTIQSVLFKDDDSATVNIFRTLIMEEAIARMAAGGCGITSA
jgi:hypothetical protein